jgi:hypothetical protein
MCHSENYFYEWLFLNNITSYDYAENPLLFLQKKTPRKHHSENYFYEWLGTRKIIFLYTLKVFSYILSGYVLNEFKRLSAVCFNILIFGFSAIHYIWFSSTWIGFEEYYMSISIL